MKNKILGGIIMEENNNKEELNEVLESETAENTIKISDDVVSIIAGKAVSEVEVYLQWQVALQEE